MGRNMVARSVIAFLNFEDILRQCKFILEQIQSYEEVKAGHNRAHAILLQVYHTCKNYFLLKEEFLREASDNVTVAQDLES